MPSKRGEIHVNKPLTDLSLKYSNGSLIADEVFPGFKVNKESDKYYLFGRQDQRIYEALRANGAPASEILSWAIDSTPSYSCEEYALKDIVTQRDRDNADDAITPDISTMEGLTQAILMAKEKRAVDLAMAAASFATSGNTDTLSGTQQWNNASFDSDSTTDAIEVRMDNGKEEIRKSTGVEPNYVVIPAAVAKVIKRDASVREQIKYTHQDLLVNGDLPPVLWNMKVLIPGAIYDSVNMGQTFSGTDMWGKNVLQFYKAPNIGLKTMTFGLAFEARMRQVKKWYDDIRDGDYVEVSEIRDEKIISEYCGYLTMAVIA